MESVLRLKVRAIGTGAGSWKPNWEGAGAGAGVGSWGALSFFLPYLLGGRYITQVLGYTSYSEQS